ncbi:MAG: T9SS type A sorting domain-containing protein [Balneolaceae bacterium]|nr:T9SS type A sorting domain-containing protein [Balneolaceae bacterium]
MKLILRSAAILFAITFSTVTVHAQLFEDFELGEKSSYAEGSDDKLASGSWYLDDALIGSLSNDKKNGSKSVRMDRRDDRMGNIYMEFDKPNGADEVSFYLAHYGSNANGAALQVQYSVDGGSSWTNIGDEITAPADLTLYTIPVQIDGNIRFKFVQSGGTDRMNIDDVLITDYIEPADEATVLVSVDNIELANNGDITFPTTLVGTNRTQTITIKNVGNNKLGIDSVAVAGTIFSITENTTDSLAFNESVSLTLTYTPDEAGAHVSEFTLITNAVNHPSFAANISGDAIEDGDVISIADARQLPLGTRVSVQGRVTVANEFEGPVYMQDRTAGIAVFWGDLHEAVIIGDSIQVTGPLNVFKPIAGPDSDFLLQISATDDDNNILFEVFDVEAVTPEPTIINIAEMNSGVYESQLVTIPNTTITADGVFQANTNYPIRDGNGEAELRIDNSTNLVDAEAPTSATNITGVVGKFAGIYQLLPRFVEDLDIEAVVIPGEDTPLDVTFDIVTWNVEWFGLDGSGPDDENLQLENVKTLITTMDADVYALQEISSSSFFNTLVDDLTEYDGILANYSQTQKTAYLYKSATVQRRSSQLITNGMNQSDWANGRFPFYFKFNATINGEVREIHAFNIHAKAFGTQSDYTKRFNASNQLKAYIDANHADDNVIFLGDFNDEILQSTVGSNDSPYANFDQDTEYTIVTRTLEERGFTSYTSLSMIDHIVFSSELSDEYFEGTEQVENPDYIGSYLSTTSDHFPVWVRFEWGEAVSTEEVGEFTPYTFSLDQNYPNPFNPSTTISYSLENAGTVQLSVFDVTGRSIAMLVNEAKNAGAHTVQFDASTLSSGVYFYQLVTPAGIITKKMLLVK